MNTLRTHNPVLADRIFFILSLLIVVSVCTIARQKEDFEVQPAVKTQVSARPGTIVAAGVRVANLSASKNTYQPRIVLPEGWRLVTRDFPFDLGPGESDMRLISFSVPVDAPARTYAVQYIVRTPSGREVPASIQVAVASVIQLELSVLDAPRFVVAGSQFSTKFLLLNKGNSATPVRLRYRSSSDFGITVDSVVQHLGPRESRQITLGVSTIEKLGSMNHTLELEAISGLDSTVRVRASSVLQIVSRASKLEEEFLEYPVSVRFREVGQDGVFAPQVEAYGYGSLNEQHTDKLEFLFRGPETQSKSALGQRDEYRLSYRSKDFEVYGGDLNYSLSPLTEMGRYATGGGAKASIGSLSGGGFYNQTRWAGPAQKETGGFLNYDFLKGATVGLNYMSKREQFASEIATVRGLFTPISGSNLDVEYGTGTKDGHRDDAYAARFEGNRKWIAFDLRYVQAGRNFGGYYRDINFFSASVNAQVTRDIRLESYARQENRNLAQDSVQISGFGQDTIHLNAPLDQYYQFGVAYSDYVSLYYRRNIQQDQLQNPQYRRQEDAVQARIGYSFRAASMYANVDWGTTQDLLHDQVSPYKRLALYTNFRPAASQNYSTSFEYSREKNLYTSEDQERLSASLNAWILFGQSTQFQLSFYTSRLNVLPVQTFSQCETSIEHIFPFNHKITIRARQNIITPSATNRTLEYALEYTVPLNIPFKRITAVGQLRGVVKDERRVGVANVLLNVGDDAALTDEKGRYFFKALKPGTVYLSVDKASIGLERITTQPVPMEINVRGGEETNLDITITRSVVVSAEVELFGSKEQSLLDTSTALVSLGGKSGIFLELASGSEVNRRVTDNRGRVLFADLRPGKWTMKVIGGDIPEYHQIIPEVSDFAVLPGEKKEIAIQLKPRKRTIKILQQGNVIEATPAKIEKKVEPRLQSKKIVLPCIVSYDVQRKGYILQISSWITLTKALRVARDAEKISGKKSFIVTARVPYMGKRQRVFLRLFASVQEAEAMCAKLNTIE